MIDEIGLEAMGSVLEDPSASVESARYIVGALASLIQTRMSSTY
jgi:hypothetical protein